VTATPPPGPAGTLASLTKLALPAARVPDFATSGTGGLVGQVVSTSNDQKVKVRDRRPGRQCRELNSLTSHVPIGLGQREIKRLCSASLPDRAAGAP
jgi:hypothetical protein